MVQYLDDQNETGSRSERVSRYTYALEFVCLRERLPADLCCDDDGAGS